MKKMLLLVLFFILVFAHPWETQATEDNRGHPWDGDRVVVEKTTECDRDVFSFTIPSVVMDIIAPFLVPNGRCPGEKICRWIHYNEHGWVWECGCIRGNLK